MRACERHVGWEVACEGGVWQYAVDKSQLSTFAVRHVSVSSATSRMHQQRSAARSARWKPRKNEKIEYNSGLLTSRRSENAL